MNVTTKSAHKSSQSYPQFAAAFCLALPVELHGVLALPALVPRSALGLGELAALAQATALATGRGESALLAMLVHRFGDPLGVGIAADGLEKEKNY